MPESSRFVRSERTLLVVLVLLVVALPGLWVWPQRGISARYHDNPEWLGEPVVQVDSGVNLDRVANGQVTLPTQFSVRWQGWLRIDRPGDYLFETRSDDGSTLDVGEVRVVDNGGLHAERTRGGTVALTPGLYPIVVRYQQGGAAYAMELLWAEPGGEKSHVPVLRLFVEPPGPVLVVLTRHAALLLGVAWLGLALLGARRLVTALERASPGAGRRTLALGTATVAASTVLSLALAEGALRLVRYVQEDRRDLQLQLEESKQVAVGEGARTFTSLRGVVQPSVYDGIVYELKPGLRGHLLGQELYTNARGLRDYEYSLRKPEGTVRIVGLGDSSLFGWAVALEDSSLKVLERKLNQATASRRFEVMNFAVPGYNTAIEAEVFIHKALAFDPDVVLVNFNTNDYDVPNFMKLPQDYATLRRSYLFDLAYTTYRDATGAREPEVPDFDFAARTLTPDEAARLDEDPALPAEYRYMVGSRGFERAMHKLVTAASARNIPVIVFDVKGYPGLHPTYVPSFRDDQRELLERLSREQGFHFLNTYPYYVEYMNAHPEAPFPGVFSVSESDSHPSVLAHAINAQALYDYLVGGRIVRLDR